MDIIKTLDFHKIIKPISAEKPAGIDLRCDPSAEGLYYKIRDARSRARQIEREITQHSHKNHAKADWQEVITLADKILSNHSKDIEIATWLTEALLRDAGFSGLRSGFNFLHDLIANYWDDLYPLPDEEGILTKVAALTGLNGMNSEGTLIVPIAMVPLVQHPSIGNFALWQYQQALEVHRISDKDKKAERLANGAASLEAIQAAVRESSLIDLNNLQKEISACIETFSKLDSLLNEKCGADAPPSSRIHAQLSSCSDCLKSLLADVIEINPLDLEEEAIADEPANTLKVEQIPSKMITSREQALAHLLYVAEFFRKTEPHSPLSYVLERAVRWGRLPLPELLKELVSEDKAREALCHLTGITM